MSPWVLAVAMCCCFLFLLQPAQCTQIAAAERWGDSDAYFVPSFVEKAVDLAVPTMRKEMQRFSFPRQRGAAIDVAPTCQVEHDAFDVAAFRFSRLQARLRNATTLEVSLVGLSALATTAERFHVSCAYDGAFGGQVVVNQTGTIQFSVALGQPTVAYEVTLGRRAGTNSSNEGTVAAVSPRLIANPIKATATYSYGDGSGFALDLFVASYFEVTVAGHMQERLLSKVLDPTSGSLFVTSWVEMANSALSMFRFVCGFGFVPTGVSTNPLAIAAMRLSPRCNSTDLDNSTRFLLGVSGGQQKQQHDVMLIFPTSQSREQIATLQPSASNSHHCFSVVGYKTRALSHNVTITFSAVESCYLRSGAFIALAASVNFTRESE